MIGGLPAYEPMLATPWPRPFQDQGWRYEVKWDGVRAIVYGTPDGTRVLSRRGNDATDRYPEIAALRFDRPTVLDGEIVALDSSGRPSFELLQARMNLRSAPRVAEAVGTVPISLAVFDVLHHGDSLIELPWSERRAQLEGLDLPTPCVVSQVVDDCDALWSFVEERELEGMVAKRIDAPYRPGVRSPDWRKVANWSTLRAVVGGFLPGEGGRSSTFASLLVGLHVPGGLRWIGQVGTGFDDRSLQLIRGALDEMTVTECPFVTDEFPRGAVWVQPSLVAAVRYKELTAAGKLRAPVFVGFTDHDPATITWENEVDRPSEG